MTASTSLSLCFDAARPLQLAMTRFFHPLLADCQVAIRGKDAGAFHPAGAFQWTSGVQALVLLFLHCRKQIAHSHTGEWARPMIIGGAGSAAASLDYAISKHPQWLSSMFGSDSAGRSILLHLIRRTNPERKRSGPVAIAVNSARFTEQTLQIYIGSRLVVQEDEIDCMIEELEQHFEHSEPIQDLAFETYGRQTANL